MELIVKVGGQDRRVEIHRNERGYELELDGQVHHLDAVTAGARVRSLVADGVQHEVVVRPRRDGGYWVSTGGTVTAAEVVDPLTHLAQKSRGGSGDGGKRQVRAYMPGRVVAVLVEVGATVVAGQGVVVLEAMKMENEIASERGGVVAKVHVAPGEAVEGGDLLFEIE
ncbi:MAG: biotin/lipoyl-containing protein [Thermoanaerobaculia bacterium]